MNVTQLHCYKKCSGYILYFIVFFGLLLSVSNPSLANQANEIIESEEYNSILEQPFDSILIWLDTKFDNDSSASYSMGNKSLDKAYSLNNNKAKADIHRYLADWHSFHGYYSLDSALYHSEKALQLYEQINDEEMIASTYLALSITYINTNKTDKAEAAILSSIAIYEKQKNDAGLANAYKNLSALYRFLKNYEKSIEYADLSIEKYEKLDDYHGICVSLFSHIISYKELKEYDKAIIAANKGIMLSTSNLKDEPGVVFRMYSYRGDVYVATEDYNKALEDFTKSWQIASDAFGADRTATFRTDIGKAMFHLGRYEEAIENLVAGIKAMKDQGQENISAIPYLDLYNCYKEIGDYKNALINYEKAESINTITTDNRIANIESEAILKYETEKKDQAIALQTIQLKQKNNIQILTIGIAGLLALLLSGLFYLFRKNQKTKLTLEKKNEENELLLKEIHHRVKNNLQTISSLLSLQSNSIDDEEALNAVNESKNRVASMALIHQKLYQGENLAAIEMRDYFETIGKAIIISFGSKAKNVDLNVDMSKLELDVDTAVPIGLITNELITNSLKHAFKEQENGQISITLKALENDTFKLKITDNGVNSASKKSSKTSDGFGSLLVDLLTTQIGGKLKKSTDEGTSTIIHFSLQEKAAA